MFSVTMLPMALFDITERQIADRSCEKISIQIEFLRYFVGSVKIACVLSFSI